MSKYIKVQIEERNCWWCEKEFFPTRKDNFFCSYRCKDFAVRDRHRTKMGKAAVGPSHLLVCKDCHKIFRHRCVVTREIKKLPFIYIR